MDISNRPRLGASPAGGFGRITPATAGRDGDLVVIAKWQSLTRADIEQIRRVNAAQASIDMLLETGLIKPSCRRESPGHPILWGTTDYFLAHFGLGSIREMPEFG